MSYYTQSRFADSILRKKTAAFAYYINMSGKTSFAALFGAIVLVIGALFGLKVIGAVGSFSGDEAGFDAPMAAGDEAAEPAWQRPDAPPTVGLQVGHWQVEEVPEELVNLKYNTGASGGGKVEWEVGLAIAEEAKVLLEKKGVTVDILPATVPPAYWADAFVAIHADGNPNREVSGYKVASPWRDRTGRAARLAELVERTYGEATDFQRDPNVTRNMRGYYAFNYRKYEHAIHRMTPGMILETGFLTSPDDREILVGAPEIAARGLVDGVIEFLREQGVLPDLVAIR